MSLQSARSTTPPTSSTRPIAATDNAMLGIFVYPFANKWVGLDGGTRSWHDARLPPRLEASLRGFGSQMAGFCFSCSWEHSCLSA